MNYAELLKSSQSKKIDFVYNKKTKSYHIKRLITDPDMVLYVDGVFRKTSNDEIERQYENLS